MRRSRHTPQRHREHRAKSATETRRTEMNLPQSHEVTEEQYPNKLTEKIIGFAIDVHRILGPGLLEQTYAAAMCIEFDDAHIKYTQQLHIPAYYKGRLLGEYRIDFIVEG